MRKSTEKGLVVQMNGVLPKPYVKPMVYGTRFC